MTLRAIADFGDGSDVIVQKPIEALHNLVLLRMLAERRLTVATYLQQSDAARALLGANGWLRPSIDRASAALEQNGRTLRTGAYEVSGTYSMTRLLARTYSDQLAWAMLDEVYRNAVSAAGGAIDIIISRSAHWYVQTAVREGLSDDLAGAPRLQQLAGA
jgi:hypothetical protein